MKKVFIIHGWGATPDNNWFPWLKDELEVRGIDVSVPQMPNPNFPYLSDWMEQMQRSIGQPDKNTILVGHSLGVIAILHYLQNLNPNEKIGAALLVSGFSKSIGIPEIENFFEFPIDFSKIRPKAHKFIIINSDNDPFVPLEHGKLLKDQLHGEFILMRNAGHIIAPYGKFTLPVVLDKILEIESE